MQHAQMHSTVLCHNKFSHDFIGGGQRRGGRRGEGKALSSKSIKMLQNQELMEELKTCK